MTHDELLLTICGFLGGVSATTATLGVFLAFKLTPDNQWGADAYNRICEWRIWGPK